MKTTLLLLAIALVCLFFGTIASAAENSPTTAVKANSSATFEAVNAVSSGKDKKLSLADLMLDLLDSDVEYQLNESSTLVVACNPFTSANEEDEIYHPASNISVELKFSF